MKILSIMWGTCSTAATMVDGQVVACVSEERFSRKKNDESYPKKAIEYVLSAAGLSPGELDYVVFAGERFDPSGVLLHKYSGWSVQDRLREQREYWYPTIYEKRKVSYLKVFENKLDTQQYPGKWDEVIAFLRNGNEQPRTFFQAFRRKVVAQHLKIDPSKVIFAQHHRAHSYYAYYASPIRKDKVLILTADAWGDDENATVAVADDRGIERLSTSTNFDLARIYRYITLLLGMKPDEHEYKVMGLAAYAKPDYFREPLEVFRRTLDVDGLGFKYHTVPPDRYVYFRDRLEGYRFDSIAGALQHYTEELLTKWAKNCLQATNARHVCFGGGVGMNVKAMGEIGKLEEVDEIFVCPSPSDESLAIGACYVVAHDHCIADGTDPRSVLRSLANAYLGPDLGRSEVKDAVEWIASSGKYQIRDSVNPKYVAELLVSGKIVGRCVGCSEFGARALGNRSILADSRNINVIKTINEKVKNRDFWMPFAPSVLQERADDYLVGLKRMTAPYMTLAFETTPLARRDLQAGLHQSDFTCRPQIVSRSMNPQYHVLISEFEKLTGVGGLLNTSFNIHGEPIIQTASDALDVLNRSGLDALILDDYLIEKSN